MNPKVTPPHFHPYNNKLRPKCFTAAEITTIIIDDLKHFSILLLPRGDKIEMKNKTILNSNNNNNKY